MGVNNISSAGGLQQYQTIGGADSGQNPEQSTDTAAEQVNSRQTDKVQISREGLAASKNRKDEETPEYENSVRELVNLENKVVAHEQAHMSVGGDLAGAASYTYTTGPDGKSYISGGEVPISIPATSNEERMLQTLERVKQAALAPADPSGQDLRVAADASAKEINLRSEIFIKKAQEAYRKHSNVKVFNGGIFGAAR